MGDFNVSCGVSMMSIGGGDRCAFIPLTKTKHSDDIHAGAYYVSNDGPIGRFHPIALPIFGDYNSYGTLENITEDCNTKAIEKFYGCSVLDFVQHMCSSHHSDIKNNDKVPKQPFGMFVKREVYDALAKKPMGEWGEKETCFKDVDLCSFVLRYLGFVEDTSVERNTKERYNRPFKHEKIPNMIVWSDGTRNRFQVGDDTKMHPYIFHPDDLLKFLVDNKMYVMQDKFDALKKLRPGELWYDKDCEKLLKRIESDKAMATMNPDEPDAKKMLTIARAMADMSDEFNGLRFLKFGNWSTSSKHLRDLYGELLKDSEFRKQMIDYKTFEVQLYHVNTPLMPSWCGIQYGNHKATLRLAKLTQKLCEAKIKQYEKDE
jgi:hypothetical protein